MKIVQKVPYIPLQYTGDRWPVMQNKTKVSQTLTDIWMNEWSVHFMVENYLIYVNKIMRPCPES